MRTNRPRGEEETEQKEETGHNKAASLAPSEQDLGGFLHKKEHLLTPSPTMFGKEQHSLQRQLSLESLLVYETRFPHKEEKVFLPTADLKHHNLCHAWMTFQALLKGSSICQDFNSPGPRVLLKCYCMG